MAALPETPLLKSSEVLEKFEKLRKGDAFPATFTEEEMKDQVFPLCLLKFYSKRIVKELTIYS